MTNKNTLLRLHETAININSGTPAFPVSGFETVVFQGIYKKKSNSNHMFTVISGLWYRIIVSFGLLNVFLSAPASAAPQCGMGGISTFLPANDFSSMMSTGQPCQISPLYFQQQDPMNGSSGASCGYGSSCNGGYANGGGYPGGSYPGGGSVPQQPQSGEECEFTMTFDCPKSRSPRSPGGYSGGGGSRPSSSPSNLNQYCDSYCNSGSQGGQGMGILVPSSYMSNGNACEQCISQITRQFQYQSGGGMGQMMSGGMNNSCAPPQGLLGGSFGSFLFPATGSMASNMSECSGISTKPLNTIVLGTTELPISANNLSIGQSTCQPAGSSSSCGPMASN